MGLMVISIWYLPPDQAAVGGIPDFSQSDIDEAITARKAFAAYCRTADFARLGDAQRKALSNFQFGGGALVPPEISDRILSCLIDPGDLTGAVEQLMISAASILSTKRTDKSKLACFTRTAPKHSTTGLKRRDSDSQSASQERPGFPQAPGYISQHRDRSRKPAGVSRRALIVIFPLGKLDSASIPTGLRRSDNGVRRGPCRTG